MNKMLLSFMDNKSRTFLKNLTVAERINLAETLHVRQEYLYQIGAGIRNPSRELAVKLEILTKGKVKSADFEAEIKATLTI